MYGRNALVANSFTKCLQELSLQTLAFATRSRSILTIKSKCTMLMTLWINHAPVVIMRIALKGPGTYSPPERVDEVLEVE